MRGYAQWRDLAIGRGRLQHGASVGPLSSCASTRSDPIVRPGGNPRRLLRAVRDRARPRDPGSQGQDRRDLGVAEHRPRLPLGDGGPRRARSPEGHRVGRPFPGGGQTPARRRGRWMPTSAFPRTLRSCARTEIGHVVVNSAMDKPWSQYFCCTMVGNREFVRKHPVATKRVLRAILKATDLCASEPERMARLLVDRGYVKRYDYALQTLQRRAVEPVARLRSRGHRPLLCPAPPRGRDDQVDARRRSSRRARTGGSSTS